MPVTLGTVCWVCLGCTALVHVVIKVMKLYLFPGSWIMLLTLRCNLGMLCDRTLYHCHGRLRPRGFAALAQVLHEFLRSVCFLLALYYCWPCSCNPMGVCALEALRL